MAFARNKTKSLRENRATTESNRRPRLSVYACFAVSAVVMFAVLGTQAEARDLFKDDAYSNYSGDAKNGEYLFNGAGCAACHAPGGDPKLLSGGVKMDTYVGTIYTPNISPDANGIGGWTNAQFLNALIHGISPDGKHYYPIFPYDSYAGMKPEDALDIKAYINTLPKSDNKVPENEVSFPFNSNFMMSLWKRKNFDTAQWQPGKDDQFARGKYLVESIGACGSCHTPRTVTFGLDKTKSLEGNKSLTGTFAPAIHSEILSAISSPKTFVKGSLMDGNKLNGNPISDPIKKKYMEGMAKLSEEDRLAILSYITGKEQKIAKPKLTVATCSADGDNSTATAVPASSNAAAADEFIGKYCRNCHGPGEKSQGSFPAGDLASIAANPAFVTPGQPEQSRLFQSVAAGRMPIGPRPSAGEIASLKGWITELGNAQQQAGIAVQPERPARMRSVMKREDFINAAFSDLSKVDEADRKHVRYFSYRHQFNGIFPCEDEAIYKKRQRLYRAGFNKLLNSVSNGPELVKPVPVAGTNELLVRVDIRDLDWDKDMWDAFVKSYPYGIDPEGDPALTALTQSLDSNIPILRADWFMSNAGRPDNYHALLKLPKNIRELEKKMGVDVDQNIKDGKVARGAMREGTSGVSDHNRMLERHSLPRGAFYWKSYDFAGSTGEQNLRRFPHGPAELEPLAEGLKSFKHDGGEMIFSLPNGLQGYYLSTEKGDRLDEGPTSIVAYRERPTGKGVTISNGRSCFDCHANGMIARRMKLREHIETSNLFTLEQQKVLLEMYVGQKKMDELFAKDTKSFTEALSKIDAAQPGGSGFVSIPGPENQEIITWYADLYERDLDFDSLAAEFDMEPEQFSAAVKRIVDADGMRLALDWVIQLEAGSKIQRFEIEKQFPILVKSLMGVDPLPADKGGSEEAETAKKVAEIQKDDSTTKEEKAKKVAKVLEEKTADFKKDDKEIADKLKLAINVEKTDVKVADKLSFEVSSNKDCELQLLYIESSGNVEEIPTSMIGETTLKAGEKRRIPTKESGEIEFDEPGFAETLLMHCKVGGLGSDRLTKETAGAIAKASNKQATRGIAIKLAEKVEKSKGETAFHMVTFNVK